MFLIRFNMLLKYFLTGVTSSSFVFIKLGGLTLDQAKNIANKYCAKASGMWIMRSGQAVQKLLLQNISYDYLVLLS